MKFIKPGNNRGWAALLLLLYCFVATPVQYWHSHESSDGDAHVQNLISAPLFGAQQEGRCDLGDDCSICGHHYAAYLHHQELYSFFRMHIPGAVAPTAIPCLQDTRVEGFSNKGPPGA